MFCPNCGNPDQTANSFCRKCGNFLPEIEGESITPRQHLIASSVLSGMTAVASAVLAILLYIKFLPRDDSPVLIYVTAGFLTAIFFWQLQVIWRSYKLKDALPMRHGDLGKTPANSEAAAPENLLNEADLSSFVTPSVTEETTRRLKIPLKR